MTGIRQSFAFCRERDGYGTGKAETTSDDYNFIHVSPGNVNSETNRCVNTFESLTDQTSRDFWIAPPPGSFFTHTSTRSVKRVQTTGSKFWDAQAYGQLQGTWEWSFVLSAEYIEPLFFAFEESVLSNYGVSVIPDYSYLYSLTSYVMRDYYKFTKINNARVKSFVVKLVIDNKSIKGTYNEVKLLKGCVVKDVKFTKGTDSSVINVSMSGFYAEESLSYVNSNPSTIYKEPVNSPDHFEWLAAYLKKTPDDFEYLANVNSIDLSASNSSQQVYSVASPFSRNYAEGLTSVSLSMSAYYTDPREYRTRLSTIYGDVYYPSSKGMRPISRMFLLTANVPQVNRGNPYFPGVYKEIEHPDGLSYSEWYSQYVNPYTGGPAPQSGRRYVWFDMEDVVMKSLVWEKGDGGSPLQDRIDGVDCRKLSVCISDYGANYIFGGTEETGLGIFHKLLYIDPNATFNGTLKTETHGTESRQDYIIPNDNIGTIASATKVYNVDNGGGTTSTNDFNRLDGWFAPYYYENIPVQVWGHRWDQISTDDQGNPVYGWKPKNVTSEYTSPTTARGWLYSSHFAEPFAIPTRSLGNVSDMRGVALGDVEPELEGDLKKDAVMEDVLPNESLINTDEENNEI